MSKRNPLSASDLAAWGPSANGDSLNVLDKSMFTYNGVSAYHHCSDVVPLSVG